MKAPFRSFYFDCDSTLASIEGVDELLGGVDESLRREIKELTHAAMEGTVPLEEIYGERLAKIAPHRDDLERVGELYVRNLVADAGETIAALQALGKRVGIISGGLLPAVLHLGRHLGISDHDVHAVPIRFTDDGDYDGYDETSLLWRNGGKPELLAGLPAEQRPVLFMGDGITDLEAKDQVDLFVGFGGIERRAAIEAGASVYLTAPTLAGVLAVGLTEQEQERLRKHSSFAALMEKS